jgi:hypothetical protein
MRFKSTGTGKSTLRHFLQAKQLKIVFSGQDVSFKLGTRIIEFGKLKEIKKNSREQ